MAFTKVVGPGIHTLSNILSHNINSSGIITATKFVGPFDNAIIGGGTTISSDGINVTGIVTATGLDVNGNGDISGNLVVGGNFTANGDFTTLNTTLREVELLRVDAQDDNVAAGIITQRGSGDILNLYDTSSEVLSVTDGGNVIIKRGADVGNIIQMTGADTTSEILEAGIVSGHVQFTASYAAGGSNSCGFIFRTRNGSSGTNEKVRITSTGNIGIGTTVPTQKLHVHGSGDQAILIQTTGTDDSKLQLKTSQRTWNVENVTGGTFRVRDGSINSTRLSIDSAGEVGIQTSSPATILHVYGSSGTTPSFLLESATYKSYIGTIQSAGNLNNGSLAGDLALRGQSAISFSANNGTATQVRITSTGVSFGDLNLTNIGTIACDSLKGDADDNTNITFAGSDVITFKAGTTSPALTINTTQVKLEDDQELTIGTGNDFVIEHRDTDDNTYITNSTGNLRIINTGSTYSYFDSNFIRLRNQAGNHMIQIDNSGASQGVKLFHTAGSSGSETLATTTTGIEVTGEVAASQDYPNFRPRLDFNFVAEKKLDPRIEYFRSGPASHYDETGKLIIVSDNVPRFDHTFPEYWDEGTLGDSNSKGEPRGLLIEETRTNLYKNNHSLKTANDHANMSYVLNTTETTAPDGTFTATKVTGAGWTRWDGSNGLDLVGVNFTDTFSTSIYMKTVGTSNINVGMDFGDAGNATFSVGQEWKRYSISNVHVNYGGSTKFIDIVFDSAGGVYIWGLQCENGAFPTSYIPTTGTTMTRGYEAVTLEGTDFSDIFGTDFKEFSLVADYDNTQTNDGTNYGIIDLWGEAAGYDDRIEWFKDNASPYHVETRAFGQGNPTFANGELSASSKAKSQRFATSWSVPDYSNTSSRRFVVSMGGEAVDVVSDSSGTTVPQITRMGIGCNPTRLDFSPGLLHFKRLMIYDKTLSDGQLQNLSAQ